jgi:hypothetical protein
MLIASSLLYLNSVDKVSPYLKIQQLYFTASRKFEGRSNTFILYIFFSKAMAEMHTMALKMIYYRFGVFNSAVNPLLYALWYRHFRHCSQLAEISAK